MMKHPFTRKLLLTATLLLSLVLLVSCTAPTQQTDNTATAVPEATAAPTQEETRMTTNSVEATATAEQVTLPVFTAETLAQYNGQNGNPAYIAVDGKVYDVTDVPQWRNGSHFGRFQAGVELTEEIKTISPHGVSKLDSVPIVGLYQP